MVKLIVTDMDNTLLYNDKTLPPEIFPLIRRLKGLGIHFAVGSARGWQNLTAIFAETADSMGFICDNGAYGELAGKPFANEALSASEVRRVVAFCERIPGVSLMLCCRDAVYYQEPALFQREELPSGSTDALFRMIQVPNLLEIQADVFRVGLHDPANPLRHSLPLLLREFGGEMNVIATDDESVDVMKPGVDKGTGLAALQRALGVTPAETMAFGDYFNDIGMLDLAGYSYAMENALDEVKAHCRFRTGSNQEKGVLTAIEGYLRGILPPAAP